MNAETIRRLLDLQPHPEGGFYRETYRGEARGDRAVSTAIYFLLTRDSFSAMHRVKHDEMFHFYMGDPVEQLRLRPDGTGDIVTLGVDLEKGMRPQVLVPGGVWQGARLVTGSLRGWALLGCTVAPGFDFADFEMGRRDALVASHPAFADAITRLTR